MRLIEADTKKILARRGLSVPPGARLLGRSDAMGAFDGPVAVKAQVLHGNRAGAGLVKLATAGEAVNAIEGVMSAMVREGVDPLVLVESQVAFSHEYYLAWRIDDLNQAPMLLFSSSGGTGIEERPDAVTSYLHPVTEQLLPYKLLPFLRASGTKPEHIAAVARYAVELYDAFRAEEAVLLEVNPLVITGRGQAMALDGKMILDDNAAPRHPDRRTMLSARVQSDLARPLELKAAKEGFIYVELPGKVAVFSAGAGLGMCLVDVLADAGLPAANFCDATGGAAAEKWASIARIVFERAQEPEIEAILVFFTLTATSIKSVVDGLMLALGDGPAPKPMVVGLVCSAAAERELTFAQARDLISAKGHLCVNGLNEAVEALKSVVDRAAGTK